MLNKLKAIIKAAIATGSGTTVQIGAQKKTESVLASVMPKPTADKLAMQAAAQKRERRLARNRRNAA